GPVQDSPGPRFVAAPQCRSEGRAKGRAHDLLQALRRQEETRGHLIRSHSPRAADLQVEKLVELEDQKRGDVDREKRETRTEKPAEARRYPVTAAWSEVGRMARKEPHDTRKADEHRGCCRSRSHDEEPPPKR